jgi:hypothetical protein
MDECWQYSGLVLYLAALATLVGLVVSGLAQRDVGAGADRGLGVAAVESLAGNDSIDFCSWAS